MTDGSWGRCPDMSRVPILVILGSTGSGKSRLGIELARRFSGEIISADSMQVYKGLDIVTAKVTKEERKMAPHHMLDVVEPFVEFNVFDFKTMALPIMEDLLARKKMPIIVGGTNYYIESLLWKVLVQDPVNSNEHGEEGERDDLPESKKCKYDDKFREVSNMELHAKLKEVDPDMAKRLHPNNRRKIIRSLQVFEQHGVSHSDILTAQRSEDGGCGLGGPLRHPNSVILWLCCDKVVLHKRLDSRVDSMVEEGLLEELLEFHRKYNEKRMENGESPDYTKGIFQNIGLKEFHRYLVLPEEERSSELGKKLLKQGIEDLKLITRRYSKIQSRWVTNRLVRRKDRQVPPVYTLDCSDVGKWSSNVYEPAEAIVSAVLRGEKPEQTPFNRNVLDGKFTDSSADDLLHYCDTCEMILVGEHQRIAHMNGAKHKRGLRKKERLRLTALVEQSADSRLT